MKEIVFYTYDSGVAPLYSFEDIHFPVLTPYLGHNMPSVRVGIQLSFDLKQPFTSTTRKYSFAIQQNSTTLRCCTTDAHDPLNSCEHR